MAMRAKAFLSAVFVGVGAFRHEHNERTLQVDACSNTALMNCDTLTQRDPPAIPGLDDPAGIKERARNCTRNGVCDKYCADLDVVLRFFQCKEFDDCGAAIERGRVQAAEEIKQYCKAEEQPVDVCSNEEIMQCDTLNDSSVPAIPGWDSEGVQDRAKNCMEKGLECDKFCVDVDITTKFAQCQEFDNCAEAPKRRREGQLFKEQYCKEEAQVCSNKAIMRCDVLGQKKLPAIPGMVNPEGARRRALKCLLFGVECDRYCADLDITLQFLQCKEFNQCDDTPTARKLYRDILELKCPALALSLVESMPAPDMPWVQDFLLTETETPAASWLA